MTVETLETARRQTAQRLGKLRQPLEAIDAAAQELAVLDEQIEQARAAEAAERRAAAQREGEIISTAAEHARLADMMQNRRMTIEEWARAWARIQDRRSTLGASDLGDISISAEALATVLLERDRREFETMRTALTQGWATAEEVEASNRYHAMVGTLMNSGRSQDEARAIADLAETEDLSEDEATRRYDADEENEDDTDAETEAE
jgi:hypothetical protein